MSEALKSRSQMRRVASTHPDVLILEIESLRCRLRTTEGKLEHARNVLDWLQDNAIMTVEMREGIQALLKDEEWPGPDREVDTAGMDEVKK